LNVTKKWFGRGAIPKFTLANRIPHNDLQRFARECARCDGFAADSPGQLANGTLLDGKVMLPKGHLIGEKTQLRMPNVCLVDPADSQAAERNLNPQCRRVSADARKPVAANSTQLAGSGIARTVRRRRSIVDDQNPAPATIARMSGVKRRNPLRSRVI
jgi:hypothetical protein